MKLVAVCWTVDWRVDGGGAGVCTGTLTHRQAKQTGTPGPTSARCHILTTPAADHLFSQDTLPGRMGSRSRYTTTQSQVPRLGASIPAFCWAIRSDAILVEDHLVSQDRLLPREDGV